MSAAHITPDFGWTEERVTVLKALWLEGWSCSQIARRLGGVTRNAVIGKAHRIGLNDVGRAEPTAPGARINARPKPKVRKSTKPVPQDFHKSPKFAPAPPILRVVSTKGEHLRPFSALGAHMCKWPASLDIHEETTADSLFCGAPTGEGEVYCTDCRTLAWNPPKKVGNEYARSLRRCYA